MLTIEQYIAKMKKKDKLDEFNFQNHAENLSAIMKYVMDYFNNYLDPVTYDYERIKLEQAALKAEQEVAASFPNSKDFIVDYYKKTKSRIDRIFKSWMKDLKYKDLYYCTEDYETAVSKFCKSAKMKGTGIEQYKELVILAQEAIEKEVEKLSVSGFKYLDNSLIDWVKETYREYGVNLFQFAQGYTWNYYEEYVERIYKRETETFYYINRYNHRYNNNPFAIDDLYEENRHRPFIHGRKGELEMLIMYIWLFDDVNDTEYWPEYVNLCISSGRVSASIHHVNVLVPIKSKGIPYPEDLKCTKVFIETTDGSVKNHPGGEYILRLQYDKDNDIFWKDPEKLSLILSNLHDTFEKYRAPYALEILSPLRSPTYNEEEFFKQYRLFEKDMKKYAKMLIVLINGPHRHSTKSKYLMQFTEDIIRIRSIAKEMKFKLKFAIDISKLMKRKNYGSEFEDDFHRLSEMRTAIVGIHLSKIPSKTSIFNGRYKDDHIYMDKFEYPQISEFLGNLSVLLNDNLRRYFVPEGMKSAIELEELVDDLLRGGFSFLH